MTATQQNIGAFFDLDGTLLPAPSLEWRFIGYLLERDEISATHAGRWLAYCAKTFLRNPHQAVVANKMYLAGITPLVANDWGRALALVSADHDPLPLFHRALERLAWHRSQGHRIFLATGTLAPLARVVARYISRRLRAPIEVEATELEVKSRGWFSYSGQYFETQWTGRLAADHMSGQAKARAVAALAGARVVDLAQSYAYGDSAADAAMLQCVGHPHAVNPTKALVRIAEERRWPTHDWHESGAAAATNSHVAQFASKVELL